MQKKQYHVENTKPSARGGEGELKILQLSRFPKIYSRSSHELFNLIISRKKQH